MGRISRTARLRVALGAVLVLAAAACGVVDGPAAPKAARETTATVPAAADRPTPGGTVTRRCGSHYAENFNRGEPRDGGRADQTGTGQSDRDIDSTSNSTAVAGSCCSLGPRVTSGLWSLAPLPQPPVGSFGAACRREPDARCLLIAEASRPASTSRQSAGRVVAASAAATRCKPGARTPARPTVHAPPLWRARHSSSATAASRAPEGVLRCSSNARSSPSRISRAGSRGPARPRRSSMAMGR